MNQEEYLKLIAQIFDSQGFKIEMINMSYDPGIDFVAYNRNLKIAVKVRWQEKDKSGHVEILLTYAGKALFDCDEAYFITSGNITNEAREIVPKLKVKVMENFLPDNTLAQQDKKQDK